MKRAATDSVSTRPRTERVNAQRAAVVGVCLFPRQAATIPKTAKIMPKKTVAPPKIVIMDMIAAAKAIYEALLVFSFMMISVVLLCFIYDTVLSE